MLGGGGRFQQGLLAYVLVNVSKMFADGKEEFVAEDLLESAVEFTNSRHFRNAIADFIETNEHTFRSTAESKDPDANELPHEYNKLFMVYQQLVDELFESLAQEKGFTTKALYRCFRDAGNCWMLYSNSSNEPTVTLRIYSHYS